MKLIEPKWHVVYTLSRSEKKVAARISSMGLESYLPLNRVIRQWSDRVKKLEVPLFPNYVFVKVDELTRHSIMSVQGFLKFVTSEKKPIILKECEILTIKALLNQNVEVEEEEYFSAGMNVKIDYGHFAGLEGIVIKRGAKTRLVIRVEKLEKAFSINVCSTLLRLVHEPQALKYQQYKVPELKIQMS